MHMSNCSTLNMIVELFISNADVLFPDVINYCTISPSELLAEEHEFQRPVLQNVKLINHDQGDLSSISYHGVDGAVSSDNSSPKPQQRTRKTKLAPTPPVASLVTRGDTDLTNEHISIPPSYPSGSTTLNR